MYRTWFVFRREAARYPHDLSCTNSHGCYVVSMLSKINLQKRNISWPCRYLCLCNIGELALLYDNSVIYQNVQLTNNKSACGGLNVDQMYLNKSHNISNLPSSTTARQGSYCDWSFFWPWKSYSPSVCVTRNSTCSMCRSTKSASPAW